jgi:hypothetical protein
VSGFRPKGRRAKKERMRITSLKMADGRIVTDSAELVRLLKADGFTVDEFGNIGMGPKLRPS